MANKSPIDWELVADLLQAGCSAPEISSRFGINEKTLRMSCKAATGVQWDQFKRDQRASGETLLRKAQFDNALKGNVAMQIWLGKQRLGQSENANNLYEKEINVYINKPMKTFEELHGDTKIKKVDLQPLDDVKLEYNKENLDELDY